MCVIPPVPSSPCYPGGEELPSTGTPRRDQKPCELMGAYSRPVAPDPQPTHANGPDRRLPLAELEPLAGSGEPVLLPFLLTRVTCQETLIFQRLVEFTI